MTVGNHWDQLSISCLYFQDTDDDETETTEESPCGRWLKRREEIKYRDVPGIDTSFLAMDSDEGVEVILFSHFSIYMILGLLHIG